jgi:hypothetical protein
LVRVQGRVRGEEEAVADGDEQRAGIVLGPRTTVFALLRAHPSLAAFLPGYHPAFRRVADPGAPARWARIATLGDLAVEMNMTWRRLVGDIAAQIARETGTSPVTVDDPGSVNPDDPRLGELRDIALDFERGGSLLGLAARLREVTSGVDAREAEALDAAFSIAARQAAAGDPRLCEVLEAQTGGEPLGGPSAGHPLDSLAREGAQLTVVGHALREELERLGGSPGLRRWRAARALVARLADRLGGVELRVRRVQQAWLPVLAVAGADGPGAMLRDRDARVLEALRLLRLGVRHDDPRAVFEHGMDLLDGLKGLAACEDDVLTPIAEHTLSVLQWIAVREEEDVVGWSLIPPPPPWPRS